MWRMCILGTRPIVHGLLRITPFQVPLWYWFYPLLQLRRWMMVMKLHKRLRACSILPFPMLVRCQQNYIYFFPIRHGDSWCRTARKIECAVCFLFQNVFLQAYDETIDGILSQRCQLLHAASGSEWIYTWWIDSTGKHIGARFELVNGMVVWNRLMLL